MSHSSGSRLFSWTHAAAFTLWAVCVNVQAQHPAMPDLAQFAAWISGEWNNNEQVWQQKIDAADPKVLRKETPVEHTHQLIQPVHAPQLGAHVFYLQQSPGDDPQQLRRQRLLRLTRDEAAGSLRQEVFELPDDAGFVPPAARAALLAELKPAQLKPLVGCEVIWRFDAAESVYTGAVVSGRCSARMSAPDATLDPTPDATPGASSSAMSAAPRPALWAADTYRLSESQLSVLEQARDAAGTRLQGNSTDTAARHRKVRYYEGWVWFKLAGPGAAADDKRTSFTAKFLLHNEGQRMVVLNADGTPSPYLLELAVLTYQNTRRPILKFALLDRQTLKSLSYTWSAVDTPTLGMNLSWFQSGVTLKAQQPNFGF